MTHTPLITSTLLDTIGVTMSDADRASLSEHFETVLDERVVNEITEELNTEQLEQLATMRTAPEQELAVWLQANVPDLREIIEDETAILIGELAEHAGKL